MRYPMLIPLAVGTLLAACAKAPPDPAPPASSRPGLIAATPPTTISTAPKTTTTSDEPDQATQYQRAIQAEREGRIVAPAGDNAFELLLSLREQAPDHEGYRNALFDLMPLADQAIRHALQQNDLAEADRITSLMTRFDADSYVSQSSRERVQLAQAKAAKTSALAESRLREASATAVPPATTVKTATPPELAPTRTPESAPTNALAGTKPAVQSAVVAAAQAAIPTPATAAPDKPPVTATSALAPASDQSASAPRRSAAGIVAPVAMRRAPVQYPEQAKRQGVEGFVELDVLVDKTGNPTDIKVVRSQPAGLFDRAAIRAMMRWKFQPATNQGEPVAARTRTVIQFKKS